MEHIDNSNYTNIQKGQSNMLNNINFNNIIYLIMDNTNLSKNIPLQIDKNNKKIIKYIIKNRPKYFILFENVFSQVLLDETVFNSGNLSKVIFLFKKLYKYVSKYNNKRFFCKNSYKNTCKDIFNYIIYILIFDDRMHIKEFNYFHNSILCLLDCCIDLLEENNKCLQRIPFNDIIHYIYQ